MPYSNPTATPSKPNATTAKIRLETLDSGLERRSVGVKKCPTGESSGEKVRALFLDFFLFAFIFTDIYFFYPFDLFLYIRQKMYCNIQ